MSKKKSSLLCAGLLAAVAFAGVGTAAPKKKDGPSSEAKADPAKILAAVTAPDNFDVTVYAAPPEVGYITCLAAAPSGDVFIGIDETGSLGHQPNAGRVVRAVDTDGDGKADKFVTFATMDHPRGLVWDDGKLWVLHPPFLTLYTDNGTGVAGPGKDLLTGISTEDLVKSRGADHTTNGIRQGIDGWIYIAMGDFGAFKATTSDGKPFQMHGGGVMRVRPDGTDLEVYTWGSRNIYDVSIDPLMNVFTRDNTNDGDNWNDRLAYHVPTGYYGYPSYFMHFPGEFIDCLADYGGGAPCGSMFVDEPNLPGGLYTVEWGRSEVDRHSLTPDGANFKAGMEKFLTLPRGTDIDVDGVGHMFVSSWANGGFSYSGPNVGFVVRVTPKGQKPATFPDLHKATDDQLLGYLSSPSNVLRQATQHEILRRGPKPAIADGLQKLASSNALLQGRVAAIFTLQQLMGANASGPLVQLAGNNDVREFALRALSDKKGDATIPLAPFLGGLADKNPRVRLMAAWGAARIGRPEAIDPLLPLVADPDPLVAHVAINSLVTLHAVDACLNAIDPSTAKLTPGAVRVLQRIHEVPVVDALIAKSAKLQDTALRNVVYGGLCRLYHREADWDGKWWSTRPDTTGPYYKPVDWDGTTRVGAALASALSKEPAANLPVLVAELQRNGVDSEDISQGVAKAAATDPAIRDVVIESLSARRSLTEQQIQLLRSVAVSPKEVVATRVKAIRALEHNPSNSASLSASIDVLASVISTTPAEPQFKAVLDEFLRDNSHAARIRTFEKLAETDTSAKGELGYAVLVNLSTSKLLKKEQKAEAEKVVDKAWAKEGTTVSLLHAIGLMRSAAYAAKVNSMTKDPRPEVSQAAIATAAQLGRNAAGPTGKLIQDMQYEAVVAAAGADKGDAKLGQELFTRVGCVACHTTSAEEPPKGPLLAGIGKRYSRAELSESILKPSAKIAQGFETQWFKTKQNPLELAEGFVVRESGDEVELRNVTGASVVIRKSDIAARGKRDTSVMPEGLVAGLTPHDLASVLAFLESLKTN